jgi:uncharacterized YccA/Bax inhibitor family protein
MLTSSNPMLANDDAFRDYYGAEARPDVATYSGVINKTGLLVTIAVIAGGVGYSLLHKMPSLIWISAIAAFVICLGMCFVVRGKPQLAKVLGPIYAIVEGVFLGAFTAVADEILAAQGLEVAGGVGVQAFIVTAAAMGSVLFLYRTGIVRPTKRFMAVIGVATGAIMLAYLATFILAIFDIRLPLISFASAVQDQGLMGFLGLGINLLILLVASLFLVIDFKLVEDNVNAGAPKYMEWYCAFSLLVTLAWIYYEAVKLVLRLAVLFGNRD